MTLRSLLRDFVLLAFAAGLGWWAHSANTAVHAAPNRPSDDGLEFQFGGGANIYGSLTLYNPTTHTLYVYPSAVNSDHINCAYSLQIEGPGGPIQRTNCPMGSNH
jgi:hypothetical protein